MMLMIHSSGTAPPCTTEANIGATSLVWIVPLHSLNRLLGEPTLGAVMNRNPGVGVMVFGVVLVVVGAIMDFAVSATTSGFDIHKTGVILLLVGIALFVVGLLIFVLGSRSRSTTKTDVRETPSGQERTEQKDDWSTS
jgi:hypothetical protein